MKRYNSFMILQWLIFIPLILPLTLVAGAIEGMQKAFNALVSQMDVDIHSTTRY
jgi:hypothetical protein